MRITLLAVLSLALVAATCSDETPVTTSPSVPLPCVDAPPDLGQRAYDHAAKLVGLGERWPESPGWQRQLEYIVGTLHDATGVEPVRDRWTDPKEKITFENIWVTIAGATPDRVVIAAHHDTKRFRGHTDPKDNFTFVGANDNASGVGLLLALAPVLAKWQGRASIQLVFLDGEESIPVKWDEDRALFGSKRFVAQEQAGTTLPGRAGKVRAMVLLDMIGAADVQIDKEEYSTPELREVFRMAAEGCGVAERWFGEKMPIKDDHVPFLDAGIPAIDLIDLVGNNQWHTPQDTLEHVSPDSLQMVGGVLLTALPEIDRRWFAPRGQIDLPPRRH